MLWHLRSLFGTQSLTKLLGHGYEIPKFKRSILLSPNGVDLQIFTSKNSKNVHRRQKTVVRPLRRIRVLYNKNSVNIDNSTEYFCLFFNYLSNLTLTTSWNCLYVALNVFYTEECCYICENCSKTWSFLHKFPCYFPLYAPVLLFCHSLTYPWHITCI